MHNNDVQMQGSSKAFQRHQRRRTSRLFHVSEIESYMIALPNSLWGTYDRMKADFNMSDYDVLMEQNEIVSKLCSQESKAYVECLQESIVEMLVFCRNGAYQQDFGIEPANAEKSHDIFNERSAGSCLFPNPKFSPSPKQHRRGSKLPASSFAPSPFLAPLKFLRDKFFVSFKSLFQ